MHKIIISAKADTMLNEHTLFLAQASLSVAEKLINDFRDSADSLKEMPERFPFLNNDYLPKDKYRKLLFDKRYLIIFQILDDIVFIDYVLDCRKDYHSLI